MHVKFSTYYASCDAVCAKCIALYVYVLVQIVNLYFDAWLIVCEKVSQVSTL